MSLEAPSMPPAPPKTGMLARSMSLRDHFAGQALHGYLACGASDSFKPSGLAILAYQIADAMLEERGTST